MSKKVPPVNYILLGHRIQPNWTLWIIIAWVSLIAFGSMYDSQECKLLYNNFIQGF